MLGRRQFIAGTGAVTLTSIAGCTGTESLDGQEAPDIETTDGPAEFAVYGATVSDDTDITVDTDTTIDILIGNRGGEPGELDFEAFIESLQSDFAPRVTADTSTIEQEIGSGETVIVTTGTVNFEYAGRYEVTGVDESGTRIPVADTASAEVEVLPQRAPADTSQQIDEDLRFSVEDISFEQHLHFDTSRRVLFGSVDRVGVQSALNTHTLALVYARVQNAGNTAKSINAANFTFAGESPLSRDSFRDIEGSPLNNDPVNPGSSVTGWILFNVPRDALDEPSLAFHRDSTSAPADVLWDVELGTVDLPVFELVDVNVPETRERGYQEFEFTIRNTGDGVGTFRGELEWREGTSGDWDGLLEGNENLVARIPAGEQATVTTGSDNDELSKTYEYRFNPFGATFVIGPRE